MGNPTNSNNKGGQPPKTPATTPVVNKSPFVIGGTAPVSGITKPTYSPGPGRETLSTLFPGGIPAGIDLFGVNNTPIIPNKTFIGTGNMPGQGYYVDSNSPEAQQLQAQQYKRQAAAAAGPFTIGSQRPAAPPPPPTQPGYSQTNSGDTQGAASVPAVPNPYDPSAYSNTNYVQPSQGQDSKGGVPPYDPYYNDSTAWGGTFNQGLYAGGRSPLIEALARRNQAPEARYYG